MWITFHYIKGSFFMKRLYHKYEVTIDSEYQVKM